MFKKECMIISEETFLREMRRLKRLEFINKENYFVFVTVSDESLEKIRSNGKLLKDVDFMKQILTENGDNFHVLFLKWNQGAEVIRIYIDSYLKHFKTISWSSHDLTKFSIRGDCNVLCANS